MDQQMDAVQLKSLLCRGLREKSGLEAHRPYLGMSGIGQCPRQLYFDFVEQREIASDRSHWYCWAGYMVEGATVKLISEVLSPPADEQRKMLLQVEVVAGFDPRFRGHIDCVLWDRVIEIKSVGWDKFQRIRDTVSAP